MKRLAASALSLMVLSGWIATMPATAGSKGLPFLPCALSNAPGAWVYIRHPPVCVEYRGARNREDEIQLEGIHWHHWGAKRAIGEGRWLTSYEFPHEESAQVTLEAYHRVSDPKCPIKSSYARLRVETADSALPSEVVVKLPACPGAAGGRHSGKPAQEIGG
jgi:hypothetical protein